MKTHLLADYVIEPETFPVVFHVFRLNDDLSAKHYLVDLENQECQCERWRFSTEGFAPSGKHCHHLDLCAEWVRLHPDGTANLPVSEFPSVETHQNPQNEANPVSCGVQRPLQAIVVEALFLFTETLPDLPTWTKGQIAVRIPKGPLAPKGATWEVLLSPQLSATERHHLESLLGVER